jgi:hypothetical protein
MLFCFNGVMAIHKHTQRYSILMAQWHSTNTHNQANTHTRSGTLVRTGHSEKRNLAFGLFFLDKNKTEVVA